MGLYALIAGFLTMGLASQVRTGRARAVSALRIGDGAIRSVLLTPVARSYFLLCFGMALPHPRDHAEKRWSRSRPRCAIHTIPIPLFAFFLLSFSPSWS